MTSPLNPREARLARLVLAGHSALRRLPSTRLSERCAYCGAFESFYGLVCRKCVEELRALLDADRSVPPDKACVRCGAYTTTTYCGRECSRGESAT